MIPDSAPRTNKAPMSTIFHATTPAHFAHVSQLIEGLMQWDIAQSRAYGFDASDYLHNYYAQERQDLAAAFAPPAACILLAMHGDQIAGCAGFKQLTPEECEVKCMYVNEGFRGLHIGRKLMDALVVQAKQVGYSSMYLETTRFMQSAIKIYTAMGFAACEPHYEVPPDFHNLSIYMALALR